MPCSRQVYFSGTSYMWLNLLQISQYLSLYAHHGVLPSQLLQGKAAEVCNLPFPILSIFCDILVCMQILICVNLISVFHHQTEPSVSLEELCLILDRPFIMFFLGF